jgi:aminopeptidase N
VADTSALRRSTLAALAALLLATVVERASVEAQAAPLSPRNANYDIDVTLDPAARTLTGSEVIEWRNTGDLPAYSLRLHLYWNAFRDTGSTFLRQYAMRGGKESVERRPGDFGWMMIRDLQRLDDTLAPVEDLKPAFRYIQPYDGNPNDSSLAAVGLEAPVPPGATLRLRIAWTGKFPFNFDRTGSLGDYFFASQWFPKLGVFEGDGWTAAQFFSNAEFYSDFGRYDVRISVPTGWMVGATGVEQSRTDAGGGRTTHRYVQDDVHDFAWTTSPDFVEFRERFEQPGLPPVDMRLLMQPEHIGQRDRHFAATSAALRFYGEWYGPYPYGHITIVDPPWQSDSSGMEYPTLFTGGTRWLAPRQSNEPPEGVVVHEAGHQFWYGIVANNEVDFAWLDEGLNEFSDSRVQSIAFQPNYLVERFFGGFIPWQFRDIALKRATDTNWVNAYRRYADRDAPQNPTYTYYPRSHQAITYHKTALWLHTLERRLGWETLQKILSTFFERWKFKHPRPEDFFAVVNEVTGEDYAWFFDAVYRSSNKFDYAVESFESDPLETRGFVDAPGEPKFETKSVPGVFRTTVVVRRLEAGQYPMDVVVTFANGEQAREHWDGLARWQPFTFDRSSKAVSAQIDPERQLLLDTNYTNNSKTLEPAADQAAAKWSLKWMVWLQDLLMTYAFFV